MRWIDIGESEIKPGIRRAFKLPHYAAGFEVDTTILQKALSAGPLYTPLSRFPAVKQDMTLKVAADRPYGEVQAVLEAQAAKTDLDLRIEPLGIYQDKEEAKHQNISFRFTATSYKRTLTDKEVNQLLDEVAAAAKSELHAERV